MALDIDSDDLATYLGTDDIDTARAELLISLAVDQCNAIVDPVPDTAKGVVLSAAGRAYTNVTGMTSEMVGGYQATYARGGVILNRAEKSILRSLAGGGNAFSVDLIANYRDRFDDSGDA